MEETKNRIVESAAELFVRNGCKRITMDQVASSIRISKRTLYETFSCKEDLIVACIDHILRQLDEAHRKMMQSEKEPLHVVLFTVLNLSAAFEKYDLLFADINYYYPEIFKTNINKASQEAVMRVQESLEYADSKGVLRPHADLRTAAHAIFYCLSSVSRNDHLDRSARYRVGHEFVFTYVRGLIGKDYILHYSQQHEEFRSVIQESLQ